MDTNANVIVVRAINVIIMPIYILLFIIFYKIKKNVFILINILFNITCMLNSIIFFLPLSSASLICKIQAFLFIFGDLSKLALSTGFVLVTYITFCFPNVIEKHKNFFFISILIICQVIPVIYGIISAFGFKSVPYPSFCYIKTPSINKLSNILKYCIIFSFYCVSFKFIIFFKRTFSEQKNEEYYKRFFNKMIRYISLITIMLIVSICYSILNNIGYSNETVIQYLYGIVNILDGILILFFAIVFLIDRNRYEEIKDTLLCKKTRDSTSLLSNDEFQIEIL